MGSGRNDSNNGESGAGQSLADAITALADALGNKNTEPSRPRPLKFVTRLLETVLPSVIMFALGYIFIQGVQLDLQRERFTADAADKLKSYVETIMTTTANTPEQRQKIRATALALGGFGGVAAYPLLSIIETGGDQRSAAAEFGLEQAARIGPEVTCPILAAVIDDVTDAYHWQTQKTATEVAGLAGCLDAQGPLERLEQNIEVIKARNNLGSEQKNNFVKAIDDAQSRIEAASLRKRERW